MKLENSNLKESVIKLMERRYGHIHAVRSLGDQVKERENWKKNISLVYKNALVTGFEVRN